MTVSEAGQIGAAKRHQAVREPVLSKARAMRRSLGLPDAPGLWPELVLSAADRC